MLLIDPLASGETWNLPSSTNVWLAFGYIVLGATVTAFLLYLFILERWTVSGASYGFVLVPIVTVILAVVAGETITLIFVVGAALVLIRVYIGAIQPPPKTEEAPSAELQVRPGLPICG